MERQRPIRDAGLAVSLLTVIPTPAVWPEEGRPQVAGWFPAVGWLLGGLAYGAAKLAETTGALARAPYLVAALLVALLALTTRFLHWDGLADVADGFWGSHDPARRLEIMSDSHTGAFGATAIALTAIVEVTAVGSFLLTHQTPVLVVPVIARVAATAAAWLGRPARPGGLGASVIGRPSVSAGVVCAHATAFALLVLGMGFGVPGLALGGFGIVLALGVPHLLALRFGGVTGDVMGASVIITEVLLFAAFGLVV